MAAPVIGGRLAAALLLSSGIWIACTALRHEGGEGRFDSPGTAYGSAASWMVYGGDKAHTRYSTLDQIDRGNVARLEVAWTYHTGDLQGSARGTIQANPLIIDGLMYLTTPSLKVIALDAENGQLVWSYDPFAGAQARGVNRGVTYWEDGDDRRILFTAGWTSKLYALDARTGEPISTFGENGVVDIGQGISRDGDPISATSPGVTYQNLYILGTRVGEGPQQTSPGDIVAYDVRTGERVWRFHTIPRPGEFGYETWPADAWKRVGGVNAWGGLSVDEERGLVFLPLGSPSYVFYGGDRHGANLFANSLVALDARTGKRVWHYQMVRHDLWDYEPASPPNLVTVTHDGRQIDAVAVVGKRGDVFLLNRETGEPLFPVEERAVPRSDLAGEETWPTQPFPTKPAPFSRQGIEERDLTDLSPEAHAYALQVFRESRNQGMFTPPSTEGTLLSPGHRGGANWSGASFDPTTGYLYVNASEVPGIITMAPVEHLSGPADSPGRELYLAKCSSCHGVEREGDPPAYPSLANVRTRLSRAAVQQVLDHGRGMMPPFRDLTEEEREVLIDYLLAETPAADGQEPEQARAAAHSRYPYQHTGWKRFLDPDGYPAVKPPWGTLTAIDLNHGEIVWQVPLGVVPELIRRGLPPTGTDNLGGNLVTAGGLLFIGATTDERFRAFDKSTGEILWETELPAGGYATPSTYSVKGKQYVVIAAGGGGLLGTKPGDAIVAFTLPD